MTASITPEPASGRSTCLGSTAQIVTRFTAQFQQQLREMSRCAAHTAYAHTAYAHTAYAHTAYAQHAADEGEFAAGGAPVLVCVATVPATPRRCAPRPRCSLSYGSCARDSAWCSATSS